MKFKDYSFVCENCRCLIEGDCAGLPNGCEQRFPIDVYPVIPNEV